MIVATGRARNRKRKELDGNEAARCIQLHWRKRQQTLARQLRTGAVKAKEEEDAKAIAKREAISSRERFKRETLRFEQQPTCFPRTIQKARIRLWFLLEEPTSSKVAQIISIVMLAMIIFSVLCFMLETHPDFVDEKDLWEVIEIICTAVFTLEYLVRLSVCNIGDRTACGFLFAPTNLADVLAIMPWYISKALQDSSSEIATFRVLRTVRLVRLFRIFKLGRYSSGMQIMAETLRRSFQEQRELPTLIIIGVIVSSSAIFYVEQIGCPDMEDLGAAVIGPGNRTRLQEYEDECRNDFPKSGYTRGGLLCCDVASGAPVMFPSIPEAAWWSMVTMTTVGFGDVLVLTPYGKCVAVISMLAGTLLIALPVAIIGRTFQEEYEKFQDNPPSDMDLGEHEFHTKRGKETKVLSMVEMSRRLRLLDIAEPALSTVAIDLADLLEESHHSQRVIERFQESEIERRLMFTETFETVLDGFMPPVLSKEADIEEQESTPAVVEEEVPVVPAPDLPSTVAAHPEKEEPAAAA